MRSGRCREKGIDMRQRMVTLFFFLFWLLFAANAISGGLSAWPKKIPSDKEFLYFVGINTGAQTIEEGKRSAVKEAIAELTEHFGIRPNTRFHERKTEMETRVLDEIDWYSGNVRIKGTLLKDWYFEKTKDGRYNVYVLVQYPKTELEKEMTRLQNEASERAASVRKTLRQGDAAMAGGDVKTAFISFAEGLKGAVEAEDTSLHSEALARLRRLFEGLKIKAVSGVGQKGELYKGLKEPLIAKVFVLNNGMEIPVASVPVIFTLAKEEDKNADFVLTDEAGLAYYKITSIKPSKNHIVTAIFDVDRFFPVPEGMTRSDREFINSYLDILESKSAVFTFEAITPKKKGIRVIVLIQEENHGTEMNESIVGNSIAARLADAGYDIVGGHEIKSFSLKNDLQAIADIVVTGMVRTRKGSDNMGWTFSSHADGYIRAINIETEKIIAQKNITGVVGFGNTEEKADIEALKKLGGEMSEGLLEKLSE